MSIFSKEVSRAWNFLRFVRGFGGGISVDEILNSNTYAHHWREFSKHEVIRYFCLLSPDFNTVKAKTVRNDYPAPLKLSKRISGKVFETISGLRPNLHLEIELLSKAHGITIEPGW